MATKAQLEVLVGEQQDYIEELEAAVLVFSGFGPHLERAGIQRRAAVDIGVVTARLRAVVELCEKIHAREDAKEAELAAVAAARAEATDE